METKYTPGPWGAYGFRIESESGYYVANVIDSNGFGENKANARLIAAAPELLEVCAAIVEWCDKNPPAGDALYCINKARAALAKAEGR